MFDTTMKHMNRHGRIALCGCISSYNDQPEDKQSLGGGTGSLNVFYFKKKSYMDWNPSKADTIGAKTSVRLN